VPLAPPQALHLLAFPPQGHRCFDARSSDFIEASARQGSSSSVKSWAKPQTSEGSGDFCQYCDSGFGDDRREGKGIPGYTR